MKKLGITLKVFGICIFFAALIYEIGYEYLTNIPGDGQRVYGDNPTLKDALGVKILKYYRNDGEWEYYQTELHTPKWMQDIGFNETIFWGDEEDERNSSNSQVVLVIALRWLVRLLPLLILSIPGLLLEKKYQLVPKKYSFA